MNAGFVKWLYTSFEGRARRRDYWLGSLAVVVAIIVLAGILAQVIGLFTAQLLGNIVAFALVLPIIVKRLHDRNKAAVPWAVLFLGVPALVNLAQYLGIGFDRVAPTAEQLADAEAAGVPLAPDAVILQPNAIGFSLLFVGMVVGLWALIELGFLRGTVGPNRFGPDPRGGATT